MLRRFRPAAISAACAIGVLMAMPHASADTSAYQEELLYDGAMDPPTTVIDMSGNLNDGMVETANGGRVEMVVEQDGNLFLQFPSGHCDEAPCPQAVVRPVMSQTLVGDDDGMGHFSFGADIRLTEEVSPDAGMNVMQFGFAGPGGHQWKLQVDYGYPSCRWSDGVNTVLVNAADELADALQLGSWYRVRCSRLSSTRFEMIVLDPITGQHVAGPMGQTTDMGAILPSGSALIGGKRIKRDQVDRQTDQFHGDLDNIIFSRQVTSPGDGDGNGNGYGSGYGDMHGSGLSDDAWWWPWW